MITTEENLEAVLEILKVLIKEGLQQAGGPVRRGQETDEIIEEQGSLARIIHLVHNSDDEIQFKVCGFLPIFCANSYLLSPHSSYR